MDIKLCEKSKLYFYYKDNSIYIKVDGLIRHIKDCNICIKSITEYYKSLSISPTIEIIISNLLKII